MSEFTSIHSESDWPKPYIAQEFNLVDCGKINLPGTSRFAAVIDLKELRDKYLVRRH